MIREIKMRCKSCNKVMEKHDWKRKDPNDQEESLCSSCLQDVWMFEPDSVQAIFPVGELLDMEEGIFVEYKSREIE